MLIYLHGLNSSPESHKARLLAKYMTRLGLADRLLVPNLSFDPAMALAEAERCLVGLSEPATLVGSSLGGFYATWLAEKHGLKAVLVNPAVDVPRISRQWLGRQVNYHTGTEWQLTEAHAKVLDGLEVGEITHPERYLLLVETGDEVLDWRRAVEKFTDVRQIVVPGGNHGFASFESYIDEILRFAGMVE